VKKPSADEIDDPRWTHLIESLRADSEFAAIVDEYEAGRKRGRKFGSNGLKVNGKIFAMLVRGKLVVKLPRKRVDEFVSSGRGRNFEPGEGRVMKEWVTIESERTSWIDLAREAHAFVKSL